MGLPYLNGASKRSLGINFTPHLLARSTPTKVSATMRFDWTCRSKCIAGELSASVEHNSSRPAVPSSEADSIRIFIFGVVFQFGVHSFCNIRREIELFPLYSPCVQMNYLKYL
jgi:hypothetical protein